MDPAAQILWVCSTDSPEFTQLSWALTHSSLIGLDAEWKPVRRSHQNQSTFPAVSLLQIACRPCSSVFLLDLQHLSLPAIYELLKEALISPNILKLGFKFKQDLVYLSSTFRSQGCDDGFDTVEPFMDIASMYNYLQYRGKKVPKQGKSLAVICQEVLGVSLSKELQCSDWSERPLSEDQKKYAAMDAECLLQIFSVFQSKIEKEDLSSAGNLGLKQIPELVYGSQMVLRNIVCDASSVVRTIISHFPGFSPTKEAEVCNGINKEMDVVLSYIVKNYGDKISLKDSDKKPKTLKKKVNTSCDEVTSKEKVPFDDWQGPPPWDASLGGDECPKFLCDMMIEGLAKHLRCVGIDAAVPRSRKPETRDLIEQAQKEKRVLLTRDSKTLRHNYLIRNQIYLVKKLIKDEQLLEVIETFKLNISEDQLMTRCSKCNGKFIQKPLTTEEAVGVAKGFQVIPKCLFNKNLKFWVCMDCNHVYWEGAQYKNAMQKFIDVCKLN